MSLAILGMGKAQPVYSITQDAAAAFARALSCRTERQGKLLEKLYKKARIHKRGSVLLQAQSEQGFSQDFFLPSRKSSGRGPTTQDRMERYAREAAPLALAASKQALRASHLPAAAISHLITVSCTGFAAPGVDIALINGLGLQRSVGRMQVGFMGCHGVINGLRIAAALGKADPKARVLLCAVELCSLHFSYGWDPGKIVANSLFADGAAALVAAPEKKGNETDWCVKATGSFIFPESQDAMSWQIGNYGFEMMLSPRVPTLIAEQLRPQVEKWLTSQRVSLADIRSWAIHPGGPRLIDQVAASLDLPEKRLTASRSILAQCGNMSSPTILFIIDRLRRTKAQRPCLALGFGPGLALEMALLT